jgi:DNA-binding CsgD family transcriptional regulator
MGAEPKPGTSAVREVVVELRDAGVEITVSGEPAAVEALVDRLRLCLGSGPVTCSFERLTAQEAMVANLARQALTNQQIAHQLHISPHTVNFHLRQIFRKLEIRSRVHLATLARADHEGPEGDRRD